MDEEASADLVARWRQGDQQAATALFHRYFAQLHGMDWGRAADWQLV